MAVTARGDRTVTGRAREEPEIMESPDERTAAEHTRSELRRARDEQAQRSAQLRQDIIHERERV